MSADVLPARLASRIARSGECWVWQGRPNNEGYGQVSWHGRRTHPHRLVYELLAGPVAQGLVLDHLCRVRLCVNPAHLEQVTSRENVLRGVGPSAQNAVKTHCPSGHAYTPDNTRVRRGRRHCAACHRTNQANYRTRKRGAAA